MNSSRITPDFSRGVSVTSDSSGEPFWNGVLSLIYAMTLTIFIALCLLGCGFMLYVLLHWLRDTQPENATVRRKGRAQDRKQLHIASSSKTIRQSQRFNCYR